MLSSSSGTAQRVAVNGLLVCCGVLIVVFGVLVADRAIGAYHNSRGTGSSIVYPANTQRIFTTSEYEYVVSINSLGFRDREFGKKDSGVYRIVALGDSFTWGMGVSAEKSWPKVLEALLREERPNVEIANLGQGGAFPQRYADIAQDAVPTLVPDMIIVAVLQGDDLMQSNQGSDSVPWQLKTDAFFTQSWVGDDREQNGLRQPLMRLYPNIMRAVSERRARDMGPVLAAQRENLLNSLDAKKKDQLYSLPRTILGAFLDGNLNPSLIGLALRKPSYFFDASDLSNPQTALRIDHMGYHMKRLQILADENDSDIVVISVPFGAYVSRRSYDSYSQMGFQLEPRLLASREADESIEMACSRAGLPFFSVTDEFRESAETTQLFFTLDGHLNDAGHALFAKSVKPIIDGFVSSRQ